MYVCCASMRTMSNSLMFHRLYAHKQCPRLWPQLSHRGLQCLGGWKWTLLSAYHHKNWGRFINHEQCNRFAKQWRNLRSFDVFLRANQLIIKAIILITGPFSPSACSYKNSQLSSACYPPVKTTSHTDVKEALLDPHVLLSQVCFHEDHTMQENKFSQR